MINNNNNNIKIKINNKNPGGNQYLSGLDNYMYLS